MEIIPQLYTCAPRKPHFKDIATYPGGMVYPILTGKLNVKGAGIRCEKLSSWDIHMMGIADLVTSVYRCMGSP